MTSYVPPRKNSAFIMYVGLPSQAAPGTFQTNPTLAAGDATVSIDGGAFNNLATLPAVTPAGGKSVKVSLSAAEMNGDNIVVLLSDAAGAEWFSVLADIQTSARQVDDLAYPATSGRSMVVDAAGLVDATTVKLGPSGSGTAQTARDIGTSVLLSSGTGTGQLKLASGYVAMTWADIAAPTTTVNLSGTTIKAVTDTIAATANVTQWNGSNVAAPNVAGVPIIDVGYLKGTASAGAAGYAGIDWSAINAPTTTVNLSGTTIKTATDIATAIAALPTANANALALLTYTDGIATGITPQGAWRVTLAAVSGELNGFTGVASTIHYRDPADTKNVITATVDAVGNRSSVTLDTT